jgi:hypothetical protein
MDIALQNECYDKWVASTKPNITSLREEMLSLISFRAGMNTALKLAENKQAIEPKDSSPVSGSVNDTVSRAN